MLFLFCMILLTAQLAVLSAPALPSPSLLGAIQSLVLVLSCMALRRPSTRRLTLACAALGAAVVFATATARTGLAQRLDAELDGQSVWVQGVVASLPGTSEDSLTFVLEENSAPQRPGLNLPRRIQVSWFRSARLPAAGQWWRLHLRLRVARGPSNPAGADLGRYYFREGIGARATVVGHGAEHLHALPLARPLLRLRAGIARRIQRALDGHPMQGIIVGLAVGIRHDITSQQWQVLAATGTGHLVAISGLHVGLVAGIGLFAGRRLWGLSARLSSWCAPVDAARPFALALASGYALLAGFALPTRRALLMLALWFGAHALRRPVSGFRILWIALIVSIVTDPLSVLGAGLWLSFGAVAALIIVGQGQVAGPLRVLLYTQWKIFAGLAPVVFAAFGTVSLAAPVANLFMIPLFSFLLIPFLLLSLLILHIWPWLGAFMLQSCAEILALAWPVLQYLGNSEALDLALVWKPSLLVCLAIAGWLLLLPRWPGKSLLLAALLLAALAASPAILPSGKVEITVLDVGHALAVVIRTHRHALVYDLGGGRGPQSDVNRVILPFLEQTGIQRPDVLLLSHDDAHHVGDARRFLRRYPGIAVISGAPRAVGELLGLARARPCQAGQRWEWEGVRFEILQPGREILWEDDDSSCVLRIVAADAVILITGDLGERGERRLLLRYPELRADVVVGLRHGSASASSPALVAALGARLAVVSTRAGNAWGLPARATQDRWQREGTALLNTGTQGAIRIATDKLHGYRTQRGRHLWETQ